MRGRSRAGQPCPRLRALHQYNPAEGMRSRALVSLIREGQSQDERIAGVGDGLTTL
jgi:hypothetical protein